MAIELTHSEICFVHKGKNRTIEVVHNLQDFGLDIENAFINYTARAEVITAQGFCNYVVSKDSFNLICITKDRYDELKRNSEK